MITVVNTSIDSWKMAPWMEIQVEEMELELKSFYKEIGGLDSKVRETSSKDQKKNKPTAGGVQALNCSINCKILYFNELLLGFSLK